MKFKVFAIVCIYFLSLCPVFALVISEVHPKPTPLDGEQKGREWIEVFNNSGDVIDLTEYVLTESKGDRIISANGDKILQSGEYAIIGQDYTKFKNDPINASFNGKFFTAGFTALTDSGEELILKKNGQEICGLKTYSSVTVYDQSVHYTSSGLSKANATPGTGNLSVGETYTQLTGAEISTTPTNATSSATTSVVVETFVAPTYYSRYYFPESEKIYVSAGDNKIGVVGAEISFEAKAVTGDKKNVNANYFWSFGDGEVGEGANVYHNYKFPGEYTVDVEGYANGNKSNTRLYVKIVEPNLQIKLGHINHDNYVEIFNKSKDEIDVGGFLINSSTLPKKLSILPNKSIKISEQTLKLATGTTKVSLRFSNGVEIANDEQILTQKEIEKRELIIKNNTPTSTQVSVYTRENYENLQKNIVKPQTKKVMTNQVSKSNSTSKPDVTSKFTPVDYTNEKFVVKNEEKNMIQSLLNYFGI